MTQLTFSRHKESALRVSVTSSPSTLLQPLLHPVGLMACSYSVFNPCRTWGQLMSANPTLCVTCILTSTPRIQRGNRGNSLALGTPFSVFNMASWPRLREEESGTGLTVYPLTSFTSSLPPFQFLQEMKELPFLWFP